MTEFNSNEVPQAELMDRRCIHDFIADTIVVRA